MAGRACRCASLIDGITEDREEYYGFDESDFPDPSSDGRVIVLLDYP
jgi:hypothetical protein